MTEEKLDRIREWQDRTEELADGAAFAMLEEYDLTMEDLSEYSDWLAKHAHARV
jgi:hypothetical protein